MKKLLTSALIATSLPIGFATATNAAGNHYGFCIGVGNPHQGANCPGTPAPVDPGIMGGRETVPTVNQGPVAPTTSGPTPIGSPATIYVTVDQPDPITGFGPVTPPQGTPGPSITGSSPGPIVITPNPPTTFTGTGPVPPLTPQATPSFTGTGQQTIYVQPNTPQVLTGTSPVPGVTGQPGPSFTGVGQQTIVIVPNPPTTFTGTSPVPPVVGTPGPSFTGTGLPTIIVLPSPQQVVTGFGPVPASIIVQPNPSLSFTGVGAIPSPVPQAIPSRVPSATPSATPQAVPILVPRPQPVTTQSTVGRPTGGGIKHQPVRTTPDVARIASAPGRQSVHATPSFQSASGGQPWSCVASGHGRRKSLVDGRVQETGALRHIGAVDVLGRDLPALHPGHADCMIAVRRRK